MRARKPPPPLTSVELQDMARTCTQERERRLLWEVSRIRRILLRAHELDILLADERLFTNDGELARIAKALRDNLAREPVIVEAIEHREAVKFRQKLRGKNVY